MSNSYFDRFGLRTETEFIDNMIAVDPRDCGCTDCIVGNSYPLGAGKMEDLASALLTGGRTILNRTSGNLYLAVVGSYLTIVDDPEIENIISVIPEDESLGAEGVIAYVLENEWHEDQCNCREWSATRTCRFGMNPPISWSVEAVLRAQQSILS